MEPTHYNNSFPAKSIPDEERKQLALKIIKNEKSITELAAKKNVSRKFIHSPKTERPSSQRTPSIFIPAPIELMEAS